MYPLLLRSFSAVFGGPLSKEAFSYWGSLLSLLFLPFAFYFIYQIAYEGWDERTAKGTLLALAFFPTTFFLNATYTESLFLALSAGSLWAIRVRKNLLLACILAGLATATRNVAIFLIVPVMFEWTKQGGMKKSPGEVARAISSTRAVGANCLYGIFVDKVWRSAALLLQPKVLET
jgi:Gpi18-like mannosyltransferase